MTAPIQRYRPLDQGDDDDVPVVLFHTVIRVTWGEPAEIVAACMDRACPRCGMTQANGFDMGIDDGYCWGARCPTEIGGCGWSF